VPSSEEPAHCLFASCVATEVRRVHFAGKTYVTVCHDHDSWLFGPRYRSHTYKIGSATLRALSDAQTQPWWHL
jgi:hypothetical protein